MRDAVLRPDHRILFELARRRRGRRRRCATRTAGWRGWRRRCPGSGSRSAPDRSWCRRWRSTGMPSLFASETAMYSFLGSTTKSASGSSSMSRMPSRFFAIFSRSRSMRSRSFLVSGLFSSPRRPSISFRRWIEVRRVTKLVSVPPSQRLVTRTRRRAAPLRRSPPGPAAWCRRTGCACPRRPGYCTNSATWLNSLSVFCRSMM